MPVLVAAVVAVGMLGLVNLLFCLGVIRRLREHTEILDKLGSRPAGAAPRAAMLEAGRMVAEFDARTVDGERVSRDGLAGTTLVGAFAPGCPACEARLGQFIDLAARHPGGRSRSLAIVAGPEDGAAWYVERLRASVRVIREPAGGPVARAFAVGGFPAFALVHEHRVRASGFEVTELLTDVAG
jgi:hypothetical protein